MWRLLYWDFLGDKIMATATLDKHEVDLTKGPIFSMLMRFAVPFIIANVLNLLFHATDIATLRFLVGGDAVAAVSATGSLTSLFINFFIGFSAGASIVLSKCVGGNDIDKARRVVGTAISFSLLAGFLLMFIGWFGAETFLTWMGCPEEVLNLATKYVQIYLLGAPIILFYNLGSGMLRAVGDSLRPMIYLSVSGVANVGLNVFFIAVFNMTVEGVAIGTVASQLIASILILIAMRKSKGYSRLEYKNLKLYKKELGDIVKIGFPTALQSSLFSISNILITSTINGFGKLALEGAGAAGQLNNFVYTIGNAIAHASMSFISQNIGAKNMARVKRVLFTSILTATVLPLFVGVMLYAFSTPLLSLFIDSQGAYYFAKQSLLVLAFFYFLCGVMEVFQLAMRAMGKSTISMIFALFFVCVFRIIWLKTFFLLNPTFIMIYISYPVSWVLNIVAHLFLIIPLLKKLGKEFAKVKQVKKEEIAQ